MRAIVGLGHAAVRAGLPHNPHPNGTLIFEANSQRGVPGADPLQIVAKKAQAKIDRSFWGGPSAMVRVCGEPNGMPCDVGTPQSGLAGLMGLSEVSIDAPKSRSLPAFCNTVRSLLAELKWLLDKATQSSPALTAGQALYDELDWVISYVPAGSTCDRDAQRLVAVISAIRAEMGSVPAINDLAKIQQQAASDEKKGDQNADLAKVAIVGGIVVAGIIGLAVLTGNAASIARVFK